MYTSAQRLSAIETAELRRQAGHFLRRLREDRGYSQREFAALIEANVYQFISQIETGRNRIPPDQMRTWAQAFKLAPRDFSLIMMRYYDPETFASIFETEPGIYEGTDFPDFVRLVTASDPVPVKAKIGGTRPIKRGEGAPEAAADEALVGDSKEPASASKDLTVPGEIAGRMDALEGMVMQLVRHLDEMKQLLAE
ncbi:helix-turn-helix transcriptional regulator [Methylobacterium sp. WL120]|uniref:helix-turn-helix domain-containing protein n=1 Tax=Methylobacterium sp. WL120 TaxID=2603887 RepID=UPI0011C82057|nr:helix-turn-helix transcriptional regulator [Methylobacterium sp. WL120]TXM65492.1 helix-turn-helix transcriptional regulator [Methylobacterium sp. WL120]